MLHFVFAEITRAGWHSPDHQTNPGFLNGHARFTILEPGVSHTNDYAFKIGHKTREAPTASRYRG